MNLGSILLFVFVCATGALSTLYIVISLFATIGYKIFRKLKYNISLYD